MESYILFYAIFFHSGLCVLTFIYVVECVFSIAECICMNISQFVHSLVDGNLDYFRFGFIMKKATMKRLVQFFCDKYL